MAKREEPQRPTCDELLAMACAPDYHGHFAGARFDRHDVLSAADLIRGELVTLEDDEECGSRLVPTDKGWMRFHSMKLAEYQAKVFAPSASSGDAHSEGKS